VWYSGAVVAFCSSLILARAAHRGLTALELGHHDSCITFANYRELVRPKEAIRYWKIKPVKTTKVVPMVAR
jgi:hypothetical protein